MDIASATNDRAGSYRRLADGLRAFLPKPLPPDPPLDMDEPLQVLLSDADQSLGRLDGAVQILPDSDLFVFMFMRREAVLSSQIEGTQSSLDDVLQAVRDEGAWEHWLAFFLAGVSAAARESADTGRKIVALREEVRETLLTLDRSAANALRLHEQLFATPIIGVARAAECLGIGFAAANRLIDRMVDCGVLRELTGHRRNRRFAYQRYIDLFAD